jgi:hypothetical protein
MRTHKAVRRQSGESDAVVQNEGASHVLRLSAPSPSASRTPKGSYPVGRTRTDETSCRAPHAISPALLLARSAFFFSRRAARARRRDPAAPLAPFSSTSGALLLHLGRPSPSSLQRPSPTPARRWRLGSAAVADPARPSLTSAQWWRLSSRRRRTGRALPQLRRGGGGSARRRWRFRHALLRLRRRGARCRG